MTPKARALAVYSREWCARTFLEDVVLHKRFGRVIDHPDYFVMGRAVMRDAPMEDILNPSVRFDEATADAWFVWLFAGDLRLAMREAWPSRKPWLGFQRNNVVRWVRL
jgi:hypothetical protein